MFSLGTVRVRIDRRSGKVLGLPGIASEVEDVAKGIATEARTIANAEAKDKGNYADNFKVTTAKDGDRAVAAVSNDDKAALYLEFGTRHVPAKRILQRAGERAAQAQKPLRKGGRL